MSRNATNLSTHRKSALLAALATLCVAQGAHAAANTVELQLDPGPLLDLAIGKAREEAPCPQKLFDAGGGLPETWLDHMEFPTDGAFVRLSPGTGPVDLANGTTIQAKKAQIVLPTIVETKSLLCTNTPGCDGVSMSMDVMFGLRVQRPDPAAAPQLCAAVDDISLGAPYHDPVLARLKQMVPETCVPLNIPVPTGALGLDFAGAAVSTDGNRLAMRVAFGKAGAGDFAAFLNGALGPGSADGFSLFIDRHLFMDPLQVRAEAALADLPAELSVSSGPSAVWLPAAPGDGRPAIGLGLGLNVSICDIGVDASVGAFFSLGSGNGGGDALQMELRSNVDVDEAALIACSVGLALLGAPFVPGLEFITAAAVAVAVDTVEGLGVGMVPIPGCVPTADDTQLCSFDIALPDITLGGTAHGTLDLQSLKGVAEGLVLAGGFTAPHPMAQSPGAASAVPVVYGTSGSCGSGYSTGYFGWAEVSGTGYKLCGAVLEGADPKNVYTLTSPPDGSATPVSVKVTLNESAAVSSGFFAAPYAERVKILTSGGVFSIDVGAPAQAADSQKMTEAMKNLKYRVMCDYATRYPGPRAGWYDPRWSVDPPYDFPVSLVNSLGQTIAGRATIANLRLASDSRSALLGTFSLLTQGTAQADLIVGYAIGARNYTFAAPISFGVSQNMTASRLVSGLTRLVPSTRFAPAVTIPSTSLPTGYRSGSASLAIPSTSLVLEGIMR